MLSFAKSTSVWALWVGLALLVPAFSTAVDGLNLKAKPGTVRQADGPNPAQLAKLKKLISGEWQKAGAEGCYCAECLKIQFTHSDDSFCVESNQIIGRVNFRLNAAQNQVELYFEEPTDVGRGGAALPWKRFDRTQPLAIIDISKVQQKRIQVKWIGFREKGKSTRKYPFGKDYQGVYYKVK